MDEIKMKAKIVDDRYFEVGRKLSSPDQGEEVVITGMSGHFPNTDNVRELRDNLFSKVDLISEDCRRWKLTRSDLPQRTGKLNDIFSFDAGFFGIRHRHANNLDPQIRLVLERTFEAIVDAGYNPSELKGTKTGVFIGATVCESEVPLLFKEHIINSDSIVGLTRSMMAQYISYSFELEGPSFIADCACCSSMYAIEEAYRCLRNGVCDIAIVASAILCLHPMISQQFASLGILSMDGTCKVFSEDADGYARSEMVCAILLQKSKQARRIYANIVHCKVNCDGYKKHGIIHPCSEIQTILLKEVYCECGIDASNISYLEAHGTGEDENEIAKAFSNDVGILGTQVGDIEELNSIANVFCSKRESPLYIGAMKTNIGHTEPASGVASVIKVLLAMESGYIPPNLTHSKLKQLSGQLILVNDKLAWPNTNGLAGVTSLGFGGGNGHLVLHWNEKLKTNGSVPEDDLPRLICASGRTPQAVNNIWVDLNKRNLDSEFIKLMHTVFGKGILGHQFRGYQILTKTGEVARSVKEIPINERKLLWIFSNFEGKWPVVGKQLLMLPLFQESLEKILHVMGQEIGILKLIENFDEKILMNQIMATMAIQLCLANILKDLGILPDYVEGVGTGELVAAYVKDLLTISEAVSAHLFLVRAFQEKSNDKIEKGSSIYKELLNDFSNLTSKQSISSDKIQRLGEHFVERIISPMNFEHTTKFTQFEKGDVLVIGAKATNLESISLVNEDASDYLVDLLTTLGTLYENGYDMHLDKLYPIITWPVSRDTPMISPLIKWNHNHKWYVTFYKSEDQVINGQRSVNVNIKDPEWSFITGHIIDGKNLFPNTGYLKIVWETLALMTSKLPSDMIIAFENVKFFRSVNLEDKKSFNLIVIIQRESGRFEITEDDEIVVTGMTYEVEDTEQKVEDGYNLRTMDIMQREDIYKELGIRGYLYEGVFKSLEQCEINEGEGLIKWTENWVPFMEAMLQHVLLQMHTKEMHLLVNIEQVIIDAPKHIKFAKKLIKVPVKIYRHLNIVRSGAIEFRGIKLDRITKGKLPAPILQAYKFIPNKATLSLEQSVTAMVQIILENKFTLKIKSVEVATELELLSTHIKQAVENTPLVSVELIVLSKISLENSIGMIVEDKELSKVKNSFIVIVSNLFQQDGVNNQLLEDALNAVKDTKGYIITRESIDFDPSSVIQKNLNLLCVHNTNTECLILLQTAECMPSTFLEVSDDLAWLPFAQQAIKSGKKLVMYSQHEPRSGVLGLTHCLRLEPNKSTVSCFLILDEAPEFEPNHLFYRDQLQKNLIVNVWKSGEWGTYRYMPLTQNSRIGNFYVNVTNLSDMLYNERHLQQCCKFQLGSELITVHYLALALTSVYVDSKVRSEKERVLGFEFSGRNVTGKRVMGLTQYMLSLQVTANSAFTWEIPDAWSLEDAATVPAAYSKADIKRSQSILIYSGIGCVSQAAINVSLHFDCNIFVIVGTKEERDYLRLNYPQIKCNHIIDSYDTSFEDVIFLQTKGLGVDIILNVQLKEKFLSPVRCLTQNGHFLYVGIPHSDLDDRLNLKLLSKGATFHGVEMETILREKRELKTKLSYYIAELIKLGVVKPLLRKVFQKDEISDAFNFLASGKCMESVLIRMREKESEVKNLPRFCCDPDGVYIILGGLGGVGLQLADWLVVRGAKKLILITRTGVKNGYQSRMLTLWQWFGAEVIIRKDDVMSRKGCAELIIHANSLGPVRGVFNLAAVIKDTIFESQTVENYQASLEPKAIATHQLDLITREMCPQLRYFVVFSSLASGIGSAGQSNYGMSNSAMERICEQRKVDGLPALAIQWGPIGDLGLMIEIKNASKTWMKYGMIQQKLSNCLEVLDVLLERDESIVSSMVLAEKSSSTYVADNIADAVLRILAFSDLNKVSLHSTFPELGMDSLTSGEIKEMLEKDYEVFLSAEDLMAMTLTKLQDIVERKETIQDFKGNEEENKFN